MKKTNNDNFIKQFGIYAGVTLLFTVLAIGSVTINWGLGDSQQMFILVNLVMALGFMGYLRMSDYRFDPGTRITDRKTLYWVCLWIALVVLSAFYRPDLGWSNNIPLNVWLLIETLLIASSEEIVFRAFGDWCFPVKGVREEAVMIICYTVFYSYCFTGETGCKHSLSLPADLSLKGDGDQQYSSGHRSRERCDFRLRCRSSRNDLVWYAPFESI